jgi:predicted nucleic acid-binding protein
MAIVKILPDTCAWIDFFNARSTPLSTAVETALRSGASCTCGIVKYELAQGVRSKKEEHALFAALQAVEHLEMTEPLWIRAGQLAGGLRKHGITIPLSDILIATLALEHKAAVLTIDRHFSQIEGLQVVSG